MLRVIFVVSGGGGFPLQGAYSNRIMSMSKGLACLGTIDVSLRFIFLGKHNLKKKNGIYEGIPYRYLLNPKTKINRISKLFLHIIGVCLAAMDFLFQKNTKNLVLIACVHSLLTNPLWWICRLRGIPLIRELNELPRSVITKGEDTLGIWDKLMIRSKLSPFIGFIAISNGLAQYLARLFPTKPIMILPINVQPERFAQLNQTDKKYITYVGALSNYKDGLSYLIEAFAKVKDADPSMILRMVGGFPCSEEEAYIKGLIRKLNLGTRVEFTGMLDRNAAAQCVLDAHILVLPRPDNTQARGGFPTKLGEYLASGIPVVATTVGDIPRYLVNGENAYLVKPGSVDALASAIASVIKDYPAAMHIGKMGRKIALEHFDYRTQAVKIVEFISQFVQTA